MSESDAGLARRGACADESARQPVDRCVQARCVRERMPRAQDYIVPVETNNALIETNTVP